MQDPDPFVAAMRQWTEIFMRRSMGNFILYSKKSGVSMAQIGALFNVHRGTSGVSDLGEDMGITSAAASQMLERLVQQQFVVRSEDPRDRRVKHLVLTDKGHQILEGSIRARQGWLEELAKELSDDEKEQVISALDILIEKARQL